MRNAAFGACFTYYLGTGLLLSKEQTADVLGMHALPSDRMMLATDEYLHGLISMANELPRLAMNAVTAGDFGAPVRIAAFVKQLHAAFQVLNLKNDILRKRFDGLKVRLRLPTHAVRRETRRRDHVRYPLAQPGLRPGGHGATQRPDRAAGHARRARLALRKKKGGYHSIEIRKRRNTMRLLARRAVPLVLVHGVRHHIQKPAALLVRRHRQRRTSVHER